MKRIALFIILQAISATLIAQCSICTKTASQMGEEAGKGFNAGVLYCWHALCNNWICSL